MDNVLFTFRAHGGPRQHEKRRSGVYHFVILWRRASAKRKRRAKTFFEKIRAGMALALVFCRHAVTIFCNGCVCRRSTSESSRSAAHGISEFSWRQLFL